MRKVKNFVGIDISKSYFDVAVIKTNSCTKSSHSQFCQSTEGFRKMINWLQEQTVTTNEETLFCMEYTGLYNTGLVNFLVELKAQLWVEMPLRIKKSSGFERGGDDKTAAIKIAHYAHRHQDKIKLWKPTDTSLEKIKHLIAQRDRIVNIISQLTVPVNELAECGCKKEAVALQKNQRSSVNALRKSKIAIDEMILQTIQEDAEIAKKTRQIQSVKGIGKVTAASLLVYTKGFTIFENAKQLACYSGVVPFGKRSGISIRTKPAVSPQANKKLKKLFHLCALSAIRCDDQIRAYFERKVAEGKNKMSVINAIRNKLVHRVFAVIRDDRFFEENYVRTCA